MTKNQIIVVFLFLFLGKSLVAQSSNLYVGNTEPNVSVTFSDGATHSYSNTYIGYDTSSTNNTLDVSVTGTLLTNAQNIYVGYQGSKNTLLISDGATVVDVNGYIGDATFSAAATSSNNSALVTGAGSLWSNATNFIIGNQGSSNSLEISDGGEVVDRFGVIGNFSASSNNSVLVTGAGSLWSNSRTLIIGNLGSGNRLEISDGGKVVDTTGVIGNMTSSNNSVLVTGAGSVWSNTTNLIIGNQGSAGNRLEISDGGEVINQNGVVGGNLASSNNSALVTGTGSLWSNSLNLYVGNAASSNALVIADEGTVIDVNGYVGLGLFSSNNSALVTGSGSLWSNSGNLYVGYLGSSNTLIIANGGTVIDSNGYVGWDSNSLNNTALITGSGSVWSNSGDFYIGANDATNDTSGKGTVTVADGGTLVAQTITIGATSTLNDGLADGTTKAGIIDATSIYFFGGTLALNSTDTSEITASIQGSGTISQNGSGTTILSGSNSYAGTTTILKGTLEAASTNAFGTSAIVLGGGTSTGTLAISTNLSSLTIASLTWNTNGVIQMTPGSQTLTITGSMANGGGGGTFDFNTLDNSTNTLITFGSSTNFLSASFSLLGITGYTFMQVGNLLQGYLATNANLTNNTGTVGITNTLNVGSYTQNSGGTLQVDVSSPTTYGNIQANDSVNLGGTLKITPINTALSYGEKLTLITSAGPINGDFSSIQIDQANCRGRLVIEGDPQAILYIAPEYYTQVAQNQNQYNVATALNSFIGATSGDEETVSTALDELTTSQYGAAFNAIMPILYQSLSTIAFNLENANNMELIQRLWGTRVMDGGFSMNGFGENMAIIQEQHKKIDDKDILRPGNKTPWGVFIDGSGIFAQANSGNMLPTYNAESGGVTTGLSYKWNDHVASGIYTGYQGVYTKYSGGAGSLVDNSVRFGLFGTYGQERDHGLFIDGLIGGDYSVYTMQRNINFSTINRTATGTPGAGELDAMLASGYDLKNGNWTYGPLTSLQYAYFNVSPFNETGASSLDLNNVSWNTSSMMYSLGSHAAYRWQVNKDLVIVPQINLSWQHEFLQNPYTIGASLGGVNFNNVSTTPLRDTLYTGVGASLEFEKKWDASLFYNASAGNQDLVSQNIFLSLGMRF